MRNNKYKGNLWHSDSFLEEMVLEVAYKRLQKSVAGQVIPQKSLEHAMEYASNPKNNVGHCKAQHKNDYKRSKSYEAKQCLT